MKVNGINLNVETAGAGAPLLLLHGFTGSASTWEPFAAAWPGFRTIAVDIIGHGASDSPSEAARYSIERCTGDIAAIVEALGIGRCSVLGYSMGGRVALRFALRYPERVHTLVLESASPGIEDAAERAERVNTDEALASRIDRDGLESFVDYWEALPMWESQASLPEALRSSLRRQRLASSALGLANSLRGMGAGADETVLRRLGELTMPVLLIAGDLDVKYRDLALQMAPHIPAAHVEVVAGAGHAVHLERPAEFVDLVGAFLNKHAATVMEARTA